LTACYSRPGWSVTAYYVNLARWNRLDPAVHKFLEDTHKEMEDKQWALGRKLSQDGIDCNAGRPTCKLATLVKDRPMIEVKTTVATTRRLLQSVGARRGWGISNLGMASGGRFVRWMTPSSSVHR
jgi:TRAP-type transport system periplasmic protein